MLRYSYILVVFWSVFGYGQVTIVAEADKREVRTNERLNLYIVVEANGDDQIQESKIKLPALGNFTMLGTGSSSNTIIDKSTNTLIRQQSLVVALEAREPGLWKIGSALITFNGKIYKSEPFEILVKEGVPTERTVAKSDAVYMDMSVDERNIYKNQPTIAVLRVYSGSFASLSKVENVRFPQQKDLEVRVVNMQGGDIEEENNGKLLSQVVGVAMIIPEKEGKVTVQPATAVVNSGKKSSKISSNKVDLNVKALPAAAPKSYNGLVGKYRVSIARANPAAPVEVDKPINIILKIEGAGNVDESRMPRLLNSETYTFYKPRLVSKLRHTRHGTKGAMVLNYVVIPKVAGNISVSSETFSYFDPSTGRYTELKGDDMPLKVSTAEEIASAKTTIERVNEYSNDVLEKVNTSVVSTNNLKVEPQKRLNWKTLVTNYSLLGGVLLVLGVLGYIYRKNFMVMPHISEPLGSVDETERSIRESQKYFTVEDSIASLNQLIEQEEYRQFFSCFEEFRMEADQYALRRSGQPLRQYAEAKGGRALAEDLRALEQQISMEKYAPFHSPEHLKELTAQAEKLYNAIL